MSYTSKYFRIDEYKCKCGCGLIHLSDNALYMFDRIREAYGKPMIVSSGCRCGSHNAKVHGSVNSAHLPAEDGLCYAMDIKCTNSVDRFNLVKSALSIGATRIGIAKTFVHVDFSPHLDQTVMWVY